MNNPNFINKTMNYFEDEIDLSKYFRALMFNLYWILGFLGVAIIIWVIYVVTATKVYEAKSLIQIESNKSNNIQSYEDILFGGEGDSKLDEQIELYRARTNQLELIENLQLNIAINDRQFYTSLNDNVNIDTFRANLSETFKEISFSTNSFTNFLSFIKNNILPKRDQFDLHIEVVQNGYKIYKEDNKTVIREYVEYGETVQNEDFTLKINKLNYPKGTKIKLSYISENIPINFINNNLSISKISSLRRSQDGSLLSVSFKNKSLELSKKIIDELNNIYLRQTIKINSTEAQKSLEFLDERIENIQENLEKDEIKLNEFKENNLSFDVNLEASSLLTKLSEIDKQIAALDIEETDLATKYQKTNPIYQTFLNKKKVLNDQKQALNQEISKLPDTQQEYINLFRNVEVGQTLYTELLNKQLEFSILEASTLGNLRIIDGAYFTKIVSPNKANSLFLLIFIGGLIGVIFAITRSVFLATFQLPSDITSEFPNSQILGVLPNTYTNLTTYQKLSEKDQESLKSLVVNLNIALDKNKPFQKSTLGKVINSTGPLSGVGKTTVSLYLAYYLELSQKKVCLIDCDYKQGDLHKFFNKKKVEIKDLEVENLKVDNFKIKKNLYFIPRAHKGASFSINYFESKKFNDLIKKLKTEFDYVIIDNPPTLSVADSLVLGRYADLIMTVLRHNNSRSQQYAQVIKDFNQANLNTQYVVYNDFSKPRGYYGYDYYAYKYYGKDDYSYDAKN